MPVSHRGPAHSRQRRLIALVAGLLPAASSVAQPGSTVSARQPVLAFPASPAPQTVLTTGPDITFCELFGLTQFGRQADIVGLAVSTTSWNVGTENAAWHALPREDHPVIITSIYRLDNDRFEQIGQSWVKHGFFATSVTQCGGSCTITNGSELGVGCTDTYSASLNADRDYLGPRHEINPWTGAYTFPGSYLNENHTFNPIDNRVQVHDADLDPAQNPGATYYVEAAYITLDDVDPLNSFSWKEITPSGSPGGTWSFIMSARTVPANIGPAVDAWGGQQTVIAEQTPPIRFVSPDGRAIVSAKTTDLGGGNWHYEYAVFNMDIAREIDAFRVPVLPTTTVNNIGFHAVESHGEPFSNNPWTGQTTTDAVVWVSDPPPNHNPLRWATLYNFRFDADAPPAPSVVTLSLRLPGQLSEISGISVGPTPPPPDCNTNGIDDGLDLSGGTSQDCNTNNIPDECDVAVGTAADCDNTGVLDACEIAAGSSGDCASNGVPDGCEADCDTNGVPDLCETDTDGDGIIDPCDNCPALFNPAQTDSNSNGVGNDCDPLCGVFEAFRDHFDTDLGWTVENVDLADGAWERGDPAGTGFRNDPTDDFDGNGLCLLTDNVSGDSDVDGGPTRVISPSLDLTGARSWVEYAYWYRDNAAGADHLLLEFSDDGGTDWVVLNTHVLDGTSWRTAAVLINDTMTPSADSRIRFAAQDNPNDSILETGVDAVVVTVEVCGATIDCNTNGVTDAVDIAVGTSNDCNGNLIPDECDLASGTAGDVNTNGVPDACEAQCTGVIGDATDDCDVDASDYALLQVCFTGSVGPVLPPAYPTGCSCLDFDSDGDVDVADVNAFAAAMTGPLSAGGCARAAVVSTEQRVIRLRVGSGADSVSPR